MLDEFEAMAQDAKAKGPTTIDTIPDHVFREHILQCLPAKDLCRASATHRKWRLNGTHDINKHWKSLYTSRWAARHAWDLEPAITWQSRFSRKMWEARSYSGKVKQDMCQGHTGTIKAVKLLPSHGLMASGSLDRRVRLWDLQSSQQQSVSRQLAGTVRDIAMDSTSLFAGCADNNIYYWAPTTDRDCSPRSYMDAADMELSGDHTAAAAAADAQRPLFDVGLVQQEHTLRGHIGPVSSLCLTEDALYSGSWDQTVRTWVRGEEGERPWECVALLKHDQWVLDTAKRGDLLYVAAGTEVLVYDAETYLVVRRFQHLHDENDVTCLEATHNGRTMYTAATDGLVLQHDLRMKHPSHILWHYKKEVNGLALEDPWLASCCGDGTVMLMNIDAPAGMRTFDPSARRMLQAHGNSAHCIDLCDQWVAAGGKTNIIRTWDFTVAEAHAAARAAAKESRGSRRARRKKELEAARAAAGEAAAAADAAGCIAAVAGSSWGAIGGSQQQQQQQKPMPPTRTTKGGTVVPIKFLKQHKKFMRQLVKKGVPERVEARKAENANRMAQGQDPVPYLARPANEPAAAEQAGAHASNEAASSLLGLSGFEQQQQQQQPLSAVDSYDMGLAGLIAALSSGSSDAAVMEELLRLVMSQAAAHPPLPAAHPPLPAAGAGLPPLNGIQQLPLPGAGLPSGRRPGVLCFAAVAPGAHAPWGAAGVEGTPLDSQQQRLGSIGSRPARSSSYSPASYSPTAIGDWRNSPLNPSRLKPSLDRQDSNLCATRPRSLAPSRHAPPPPSPALPYTRKRPVRSPTSSPEHDGYMPRWGGGDRNLHSQRKALGRSDRGWGADDGADGSNDDADDAFDDAQDDSLGGYINLAAIRRSRGCSERRRRPAAANSSQDADANELSGSDSEEIHQPSHGHAASPSGGAPSAEQLQLSGGLLLSEPSSVEPQQPVQCQQAGRRQGMWQQPLLSASPGPMHSPSDSDSADGGSADDGCDDDGAHGHDDASNDADELLFGEPVLSGATPVSQQHSRRAVASAQQVATARPAQEPSAPITATSGTAAQQQQQQQQQQRSAEPQHAANSQAHIATSPTTHITSSSVLPPHMRVSNFQARTSASNSSRGSSSRYASISDSRPLVIHGPPAAIVSAQPDWVVEMRARATAYNHNSHPSMSHGASHGMSRGISGHLSGGTSPMAISPPADTFMHMPPRAHPMQPMGSNGSYSRGSSAGFGGSSSGTGDVAAQSSPLGASPPKHVLPITSPPAGAVLFGTGGAALVGRNSDAAAPGSSSE